LFVEWWVVEVVYDDEELVECYIVIVVEYFVDVWYGLVDELYELVWLLVFGCV